MLPHETLSPATDQTTPLPEGINSLGPDGQNPRPGRATHLRVTVRTLGHVATLSGVKNLYLSFTHKRGSTMILTARGSARIGSRTAACIEQWTPGLWVSAFLMRKYVYQRGLQADAVAVSAASTREYIRTLRTEGIVVIPNFLDADVIARMREAVPPVTEFTEAEQGENSHFYRDARKISAFAPFFASSVIRQVARSHISPSADIYRAFIGLKMPGGRGFSFENFYHMDCWKQRVKVYLYLEDISEDGAPMTYLKGSHRGSWRLPMESRLARLLRSDANGYTREESVFLGCFWPYEVMQLKQAHGYTDVTCTGKAGSLVIFDGRGLHHANVLRSQRRLILSTSWIHPGHHT